MKGFRFYIECVDKRKDARQGDVLAVYTTRERDGRYLVCGSSCQGVPIALEHSTATARYLRTHCTRISEAEARKRNPHLFARLVVARIFARPNTTYPPREPAHV